MKITNSNRATLAARLRAMRRAQFGALAMLSIGTIKALARVEDRHVARLVNSITETGKTDDTITDEETHGAISRFADSDEVAGRGHAAHAGLTFSERIAIEAARPGSRSVIFRKAAPVAADEPLPADFTPSPVAEFESALIRDEAIEKQAQIDAAIEVAEIAARDERDAAAVSFVSDYSPEFSPSDFAPVAVKIARVTVAPTATPVFNPATASAAELLASILANAPRRRAVHSAL